MKDMKIQLIMTPPAGRKEVMDIKSCIIGGFMNDGSELPFGAYMGDLNPIDSNIALMHMLRAFIKLNVEETPLTHKQIGDLIKLSVDRAVHIEDENSALDNVDLDTHVLKMKWDKRVK